MGMERTDLAIIGSGPAGLAAAAEAVEHGVSVTLLDEDIQGGGQYFRQFPPTFQKTARLLFEGDETRASSLLQVLEHPRVKYFPQTTVWGLFEDRIIAYARGTDSGRLSAEHIIVAAGAYDRPVPFPGWTLPNVMTAGGVLNLLKGQGVIPGGRVLVSGNGPITLAVACYLHWAGSKVVEVCETTRWNRNWPQFLRILAAPSLLGQGIRYRTTLWRAGIPFRTGHIVVEARGEDRVKEGVIAPIDAEGRVDRSRARSVEVDALVLAFGFHPSVEFTRLTGCKHIFDSLKGGWVPVRSPDLETTVPNVFSVGDCAGIRGADIALLEGRLAGLTVASRMGRVADQGKVRVQLDALRARLKRLNRIRDGFDQIFAPPRNFLSLITEDTLLCRCEEVTAGELWAQLRKRKYDITTLKSLTRISMGRCQGRNCLGTIAAILANELDYPQSDINLPRVRPPLKPILLGDLLHESLSPAKPEMTEPRYF